MKLRGGVVLLLLAGSAISQSDAGSTVRRVRVQLDFTNGVCDYSTHVKILEHNGLMAEGNADDRCQVEFTNIPEGTYQVNVSGQNFPSTDDTISASNGSADFDIKVKREGARGTASVSALDLAIPSKAQKDFDKAQSLIDRGDLKKAIESLHNAIAIYPSYVDAYNNLGVVYARLGDRDEERDALHRALSINAHFAPAYVNLARMDISTGDFAGAETELSKATSNDPTDAMTLVLLTYSEFMNRHFDSAIATSYRA